MIVQTLDKIGYSIIDTVRPILKRTDFIDIRDVTEWVKEERNFLAKQQIDKNSPFIPKGFLQSEKVTTTPLKIFNKYPDINVITTQNLPKILSYSKGTYAIDSISYKDFFVDKIHFIDNSNSLLNYVNSDRFDKQSLYSTIINGELVIAGKDSILVRGLQEVYVKAVYTDPESISTFNVKTDIFPIEESLISLLENKVIKERYGIQISNYYDSINNEKHDLTNSPTK